MSDLINVSICLRKFFYKIPFFFESLKIFYEHLKNSAIFETSTLIVYIFLRESLDKHF